MIQVEGRTRRSKQMGNWNSRMEKLVQAYMFWERTTDSGRAAEELPGVVWCPCGESASHNWEEMLLVTMKGMPEVNGRLALPLLTDSFSQGYNDIGSSCVAAARSQRGLCRLDTFHVPLSGRPLRSPMIFSAF